jgi:hypothetical protein
MTVDHPRSAAPVGRRASLDVLDLLMADDPPCPLSAEADELGGFFLGLGVSVPAGAALWALGVLVFM